MFLSKSPQGIYYLWFTDSNGKKQKVSTRCKFKTDALKFLQTFKTEEHQKRIPKQVVLLQSFIGDYLVYAEGSYAKKSVALCRMSLNNLLAFLGNSPLASITPQCFDNYKVERLKHVSPVSVNVELRTIRSAFNTAVRWGAMQSNPFAKQKLASVPEASPIFFSKEDFQILISKIKEGWLKEIVVFATLTGLRRGEIVNLRWSDVDLQRMTVVVQSSPTFKTKNGKKRTLPLNDTAAYILQSKANKTVSELVFTLNDKLIYADWISHKFKYYVVECKFREKRLHFHSLRHTFASWLVQDGVSIYAVKELLGHSDVKTTQVYSHLQPEQLHSTVNRLHVSLN